MSREVRGDCETVCRYKRARERERERERDRQTDRQRRVYGT